MEVIGMVDGVIVVVIVVVVNACITAGQGPRFIEVLVEQ
jgi:hypothetical protein